MSARSLPPQDKDYALGMLAAEVAALRRSDEKMGGQLEAIARRVEDVESSTLAAKGAVKMASWLLGSTIVLLLSLGGWLIQTTIVDRQRIEVLERDIQSVDANLTLYRDTMNTMREELRELKTLQGEARRQEETRDEEIRRLLAGRPRR